jgi:hypothetical protein
LKHVPNLYTTKTSVTLMTFLVSLPLTAQTVVGLIPARSTVSIPATLTPVGYLQFETGTLGATASPEFDTRVGINHAIKLAVLPRLEFFVQTEPCVQSSLGGDKEIRLAVS